MARTIRNRPAVGLVAVSAMRFEMNPALLAPPRRPHWSREGGRRPEAAWDLRKPAVVDGKLARRAGHGIGYRLPSELKADLRTAVPDRERRVRRQFRASYQQHHPSRSARITHAGMPSSSGFAQSRLHSGSKRGADTGRHQTCRRLPKRRKPPDGRLLIQPVIWRGRQRRHCTRTDCAQASRSCAREVLSGRTSRSMSP